MMKISNNVGKVKLQSRISVITRNRLNKVTGALKITGTQAISDMIEEEYEKLQKKGD